jgi:hypothetical protein
VCAAGLQNLDIICCFRSRMHFTVSHDRMFMKDEFRRKLVDSFHLLFLHLLRWSEEICKSPIAVQSVCYLYSTLDQTAFFLRH